MIELMIVVGIIAILVSLAIPSYTDYTLRAKFSEIVLATIPAKIAIETAIQLGKVESLDELDGGKNGIPADIPLLAKAQRRYRYLESLETKNGLITAKGTGEVENLTLTWRPEDLKTPVRWKQEGTCIDKGLC